MLDDPAYPAHPFLMKEFYEGGRNEREKFFSCQCSSLPIPVANSFGRLKAQFRCLQRPLDVKLDTLPQETCSCFVLHNYCENKKENFPDQNLMSALIF